MKKYSPLSRFLIHLVVLTLFFALGWNIEAAPRKRSKGRSASAQKRGKSARGRSRSARSRSRVARGRSRGRRSVRVVYRRGRGGRRIARRVVTYDFPPGAADDSPVNDPEQAGAKINDPELRAHIRYLADDLLEGRGPGARGGMLAAKYIAAKFESLGLEPAATDRTFFQQAPMVGTRADAVNKLTIKSGGKSEEFRFGDDFVGTTELEQSEIPVNAELVFVGYGIQAPENNWDDYKGLDVRGKVLVMMVNDPPATAAEPNLFGGKALTYYGRWTYKYEEAARRGAAGVILIHTTESAGYGWNVVKSSWSGERFGLMPDGSVNALPLKSWMTEEAARRLMQLAGQNPDSLRQTAQTREFKPVALNARVDSTLKVVTRRLTSPNVVGILRGDDDKLKNEYIVYSAHWDHFGMRADQSGDNIYNGAVDNATGVAGILAIAKAFASLEEKPKRSILFIATTAEEQGLLGAEYYARHPLVPLARTIANINLDSLNIYGLTSDITPLGAERSTLGKFIEEVAKENQVTISPDAHPEQGLFYRSDHFPFAKAGVPAVNFEPGSSFVGHSADWGKKQFEDYNANRYHQPSDEYSPNWDFSGMVQQTRLAFWVGLKVANADDTPKWNPGDEFERTRLQSLSSGK
jgi:Zn-dependent M28 family amino/carboxypeptidase